MTATGLALENAFQSGSCAAVPRINRRARAQAARALKDYCLLDEQGKRLGTITAARVKPVLGKDAPTIYLMRETQLHR
ncbi:MAG: hypothetical protein IH876_12915 [Gemmatimonadetes bacterium]|nr:hypothetical protein [Gemmatimonadota bacterium]